jgi:hypothetical protein
MFYYKPREFVFQKGKLGDSEREFLIPDSATLFVMKFNKLKWKAVEF